MNSHEFIDGVRKIVRDGAAAETLRVLQKVPGRRPSDELRERSEWYNSLGDEQKRVLSSILLDAVDRAVFGFLCVLDGVRAIESDADKGKLELRYVKNDSVLLNPQEGEMLHDLW
jgi:hypothetical protein